MGGGPMTCVHVCRFLVTTFWGTSEITSARRMSVQHRGHEVSGRISLGGWDLALLEIEFWFERWPTWFGTCLLERLARRNSHQDPPNMWPNNSCCPLAGTASWKKVWCKCRCYVDKVKRRSPTKGPKQLPAKDLRGSHRKRRSKKQRPRSYGGSVADSTGTLSPRKPRRRKRKVRQRDDLPKGQGPPRKLSGGSEIPHLLF